MPGIAAPNNREKLRWWSGPCDVHADVGPGLRGVAFAVRQAGGDLVITRRRPSPRDHRHDRSAIGSVGLILLQYHGFAIIEASPEPSNAPARACRRCSGPPELPEPRRKVGLGASADNTALRLGARITSRRSCAGWRCSWVCNLFGFDGGQSVVCGWRRVAATARAIQPDRRPDRRATPVGP